MAKKTDSLEARLNEIFARGTPRLPDNAKKALVEWAPIMSFVSGALALLAAWSLWHWATVADTTVYYAGAVCTTYSGYICPAPGSRFSVWLWLSVIFLAVEGLFYLFAYPKLNNHKKEGWNYLYYGISLNAAYTVTGLFTPYNSLSRFIGALVISAVGFYLVFQVRESYIGSKRLAPAKTTGKDLK